MTNFGWKCHTRTAPLWDIFNLGSSYLNVALTAVHHLYDISNRFSETIECYQSATWSPDASRRARAATVDALAPFAKQVLDYSAVGTVYRAVNLVFCLRRVTALYRQWTQHNITWDMSVIETFVVSFWPLKRDFLTVFSGPLANPTELPMRYTNL